MAEQVSERDTAAGSTRRRFLEQVGQSTLAGGLAVATAGEANRLAAAEPEAGKVKRRPLGRTGLLVAEIGFGGHSWSYKKVPAGNGEFRKVTQDEAVEMIRAGLELGVNFFDSCTPLEESSIPGEALKRLGMRDQAIIAVRVTHKMKGVPADKEEVYKWTEERLKLWQTDCIDLLMLCNTENDTPQSGYWEMSHSIEALERMKQQGKARFTGFGCHFTPELFLEAFEKYGKAYDVCSIPYNIRHRAAETILPAARKAGLGVITIKPFARGSLLKDRDLEGADAGLPRDMIAFVLENELVDVCSCGFHTLAQLKENFSASWTKLTPAGRNRLEGLAASTPCREYRWLEEGWLV